MNNEFPEAVHASEPSPTGRLVLSLRALLWQFLKIGTIGFGGGMAVIALMERDLVREKRALDAEEFLHGVGLGQVLGPFAVNTALFVGNRLHGILGGLLCAGVFMAPSLLLVILLSWLYFSFHAIPALQDAIGGLGPVVIALILSAAWSMGKKAVRHWPAVLLAMLALGLSVLKVNPVYILATAGAAGLLAGRSRLGGGSSPGASGKGEGFVHGQEKQSGGERGIPTHLASFSPILPVQTLAVTGSAAVVGGTSLTTLAWAFLKVGFIFFGGGFVLVPILQQRLVENLHWLTAKEFLDGVAISNLTPGPIAVLATFAGYHLLGVPGAVVATLALFAPALVLMSVFSHEYARLKEGRRVQDFLAGITPAVVGLVVGAAVLLAPGALHGLPGWGLMVLSLILLVRFRWPPAFVLATGAALGAAGWIA